MMQDIKAELVVGVLIIRTLNNLLRWLTLTV
jgi:hypothetical protein